MTGCCDFTGIACDPGYQVFYKLPGATVLGCSLPLAAPGVKHEVSSVTYEAHRDLALAGLSGLMCGHGPHASSCEQQALQLPEHAVIAEATTPACVVPSAGFPSSSGQCGPHPTELVQTPTPPQLLQGSRPPLSWVLLTPHLLLEAGGRT